MLEVDLYVKLLGTPDILQRVFAPMGGQPLTRALHNVGQEVVSFSKHICARIEALKAYENPLERSKLFGFYQNGEIKILSKNRRSQDLMFLEHVKTGDYVHPKMYDEGTNKALPAGIEQSNRLLGGVIPVEETLVDGFRYHSAYAHFDETGKDISRFRNGHQEITIIDRTVDAKLVETINTFKARITSKNFSEQEKMEELLKYVEEVFSVKSTGTEIDELAHNMHKANSLSSYEVFLGDVINSGAGVCRHRALLTKVLGDEIGLRTAFVQGYYSGDVHAWNEINTKDGRKYLFDAMFGSIFDVSNTSRSVMPQIFSYQIDPKDTGRLVSKFLDPESTVGLIYRCLAHKQRVLIPNTFDIVASEVANSRFSITPTGKENIFVNNQIINAQTQLHQGDWIQVKDLGFQII